MVDATPTASGAVGGLEAFSCTVKEIRDQWDLLEEGTKSKFVLYHRIGGLEAALVHALCRRPAAGRGTKRSCDDREQADCPCDANKSKPLPWGSSVEVVSLDEIVKGIGLAQSSGMLNYTKLNEEIRAQLRLLLPKLSGKGVNLKVSGCTPTSLAPEANIIVRVDSLSIVPHQSATWDEEKRKAVDSCVGMNEGAWIRESSRGDTHLKAQRLWRRVRLWVQIRLFTASWLSGVRDVNAKRFFKDWEQVPEECSNEGVSEDEEDQVMYRPASGQDGDDTEMWGLSDPHKEGVDDEVVYRGGQP